eukprot:283214-Pyramimonas_sp.AAC.1
MTCPDDRLLAQLLPCGAMPAVRHGAARHSVRGEGVDDDDDDLVCHDLPRLAPMTMILLATVRYDDDALGPPPRG